MERIIECIQQGKVSFDGEEWSQVSSHAISVTKGLLTVNTSMRLTLDALLRHPWLDSAPTTPLCNNLSLKKLGATKTAINHTLSAYHQATSNREGMVLGDPAQNPLARKRKQKSGKSPQATPPGSISSRPTTLEIGEEEK